MEQRGRRKKSETDYRSLDFSWISSKVHLRAKAGISFGTNVKWWKSDEMLSNTFYASTHPLDATQPHSSRRVVMMRKTKVRTWHVAFGEEEEEKSTASKRECPRMKRSGSLR